MSTAGVVTGYNSDQSAAAIAGLPLGSTVVRVDGVEVRSKRDVKAQLQVQFMGLIPPGSLLPQESWERASQQPLFAPVQHLPIRR